MLTASARARGTLLKRDKWRHGVKALLCVKKAAVRAAEETNNCVHTPVECIQPRA